MESLPILADFPWAVFGRGALNWQVVPVCRKRGDKFYMKGIQALAFVRRKLGAPDEL